MASVVEDNKKGPIEKLLCPSCMTLITLCQATKTYVCSCGMEYDHELNWIPTWDRGMSKEEKKNFLKLCNS